MSLEQTGPVALEYVTSRESTDIVHVRDEYGLFIDGQWVAPRSGRGFETINPATEAKLSTVADGGAEDVDAAVAAARRASDKVWSSMPGRERAKYLYRIARLLQERS